MGFLNFCFYFVQVHYRTYEDLLTHKKFEILRSTRHYGGLLYYLAKQKKLNELLDNMMDREQ